MGKNTSVSPGVHFECFVDEQISEEISGVVLRKAIQEGLDSKIAINFDPAEHLKSLKSGRKAEWI